MKLSGIHHRNRRRDQRGFAVAEIMGVVLMLYVFLSGDPKSTKQSRDDSSS